MITCPSCGKTHVDNTLFCSECGDYLLEDDSPVTDAVGVRISSLSAFDTDEVVSNPAAVAGTGPLAVGLRIGENERRVNIALHKPIHMGRIDPGSNIFPEVDLTQDGGVEQGVSRRHARIMKRGANIYIEDLGSSNGTFINGQKLSPYFPEALSDGDKVRLGRLRIEVDIGA